MKNTSVEPTPAKSIKTKGPIRTGAVVPTLIVFVLVYLYFFLFFDHNLKSAVEYIGTSAMGAEVDVARIHTSFLNASFEMDGLEITDKSQPTRDLVKVGIIRFKALWDGLLRAKVVIDDASILDIEVYAPRKHPGYVAPPPPPSNKPSALADAEKEVLNQTQKQFNGNMLGDVANLLNGADPSSQLKNIQGSLKSNERIQQLQKELDAKKAEWDKRLKDLPQQKDIDDLQKQIKSLKFDAGNPAEFAKNVAKAKDILKLAQDKANLVDQMQKAFTSDLNNYNQQYKDLEKLVQEDVKGLQSRFKIPNIDAREFSTNLFINMLEKKLVGMRKYIEIARHYIPTKSAQKPVAQKKEEPLVPPKRSAGKTFHYAVTTGYPLFWLKKAAISSEISQSALSGNVKGEIRDVTTDQAYLGRPTLVLLDGDFPKQAVHGLNAKITLDHRTDEPKESLEAKVARFPTGPQMFSDTSDVKFGLTDAKGSSQIEATMVGNNITMAMHNQFSDVKYVIDSKTAMVKDILESVMKGIPSITMNANVSGSWDHLNIGINSNLGDELSKGFQKQIQARIDEAKGKLQKLIDEQIGGNKKNLQAQLSSFGGEGKDLNKSKDQIDKAVKSAQGGSNAAPTKNLEEQGKKLLKGLGF
jgi:uncharacterized protein (TIGR03545 family)